MSINRIHNRQVSLNNLAAVNSPKLKLHFAHVGALLSNVNNYESPHCSLFPRDVVEV